MRRGSNQFYVAAFFILIVLQGGSATAMESTHEHAKGRPLVEEEVDGMIVRKCPRCGEIIETVPKEEEREFTFGADASFFSKYVSRGINTTDGWVFQPYAWASYKNLTLGVWANQDLTDVNGEAGEFTELDIVIDYSREIKGVTLSAGGIYYIYPNTETPKTAEVYAGAGLEGIFLKPKLAVYYDFMEANGFYASFNISHSFDLTDYFKLPSSAEVSAQAGWGSRNFNDYNFGSRHDAFTDLVLTAALPVQVMDHLSIKPAVSYSTALDRTVRSKISKDDNFIWGGTLSYSY